MNNDIAMLYPFLLGLFAVAVIAEMFGRHYAWNRQTLKGSSFAIAGIAAHALVAAPVIAVVLGLVFNHVFPNTRNALAHTSFWLVFPVYFIVEEFCHYWLHRWAHEWRWLWKLHRTHHSASRLNVLVLYRYNIFWTVLLPQAWFGAIAVHLGLLEVFMVSTAITFTVNALTHTAYRWDLALRRWPVMDAALNVIEKFITLPDTHHAHHGLGRHGHARGNYAVTIFWFDVLLGTAKFPHARQERFGLPGQFDWKEELFWPLFRKGMIRKPIPGIDPAAPSADTR